MSRKLLCPSCGELPAWLLLAEPLSCTYIFCSILRGSIGPKPLSLSHRVYRGLEMFGPLASGQPTAWSEQVQQQAALPMPPI